MCCAISGVLPINEDVAQVGITYGPVSRINVIASVYAHQVVEVYLIDRLILCLVEVQLIRHLIREEESLYASLFVTHGVSRGKETAHQSDDCYYILFHSGIVFI